MPVRDRSPDVDDFLVKNKGILLNLIEKALTKKMAAGNEVESSPRSTRSRSQSVPRKREKSARISERSPSRSPPRRRKDRRRSRTRSRTRSRSRTYSPLPRGRGEREYYSGRDYGRQRYRDGRDRPEPNRCIGIFGMSLNTNERDLENIFSEFGTIDQVLIVKNRDTGRSRGFGFIYFTRTKYAMKARDEMADATIDGMKVRVDFSVTEKNGGGGGGRRY
ncbi:unnamed protein product, partial [Mesorhabditis spiculigera]